MKVAEVPVAGRKLWKVLVTAVVALMAVAIPGAFYFRSRQTGMSGNRSIRSIAVLPFAKMLAEIQTSSIWEMGLQAR